MSAKRLFLTVLAQGHGEISFGAVRGVAETTNQALSRVLALFHHRGRMVLGLIAITGKCSPASLPRNQTHATSCQ